MVLEPPPTAYLNRLRCEACGRISREDERSWRAYLGVEDDDTESVVVFRPTCVSEVDAE